MEMEMEMETAEETATATSPCRPSAWLRARLLLRPLDAIHKSDNQSEMEIVVVVIVMVTRERAEESSGFCSSDPPRWISCRRKPREGSRVRSLPRSAWPGSAASPSSTWAA